MQNEEMLFEIFDEKGNLKNKEDVMKDFEALYDSLSEEKKKENNFIGNITNPDSLIDIDASLDTFNFLERTIYITDEITQEMANSFYSMIVFWNKADEVEEIDPNNRKPIKVYINGSETAPNEIIHNAVTNIVTLITFLYPRTIRSLSSCISAKTG